MDKHINVTVDFSQWQTGAIYDLRIPSEQPVQRLIINLAETLGLTKNLLTQKRYVLRIVNKGLVLSDDDILTEYQVTDGDIIQILS